MSSDPQSGDRSSGPEPTSARGSEGAAGGTPRVEPDLATRVRGGGSELLEALQRHLPGSREHADGTASYAFAAAVELGLDRSRAEAVRETARVHEIGKVYMPSGMLARPQTELGPGDQALVDSHAAYGAQLARGAGIPPEACEWILATRESFDGSGPTGLSGKQIPLESRIIRAACAHDALLATLPATGTPAELYRTATDLLRGDAGRELDPQVVAALTGMLERVV
jgi:two-component system, response regulator RpfG